MREELRSLTEGLLCDVQDENKILTFKDLKVWQKAHQLALAAYKESAVFPREEMYGLTSQLRRAAVSTAANIVEGSNLAEASNEEVKHHLLLASDLNFLSSQSGSNLARLAEEVGAMLHVFIRKLNS